VSSVETAGWSQPSPRLWKMRVAELSLLGLIALVVAVVAAANERPVARVVSTLVVVCAVAGAVTLVRSRYRSWGYLERDEDLLVRRGVVIRRLSVVPYGRMQFVEVTAGLVERIFRLSTVKLHTAAARSDARIPGLDPAEAARLRDRLAALGEAKAAGL
jgi:uncharacterized protein